MIAHRLAGTLGTFSGVAGAFALSIEDSAACAALVDRLDGMCSELLEVTRTLRIDALGADHRP